jgi:hypothetical protein
MGGIRRRWLDPVVLNSVPVLMVYLLEKAGGSCWDRSTALGMGPRTRHGRRTLRALGCTRGAFVKSVVSGYRVHIG